MTATPDYLVLAKIMRPHGIRGELNLQVITDFPERLRTLEAVYIGVNEDGTGKLRRYSVESARPQKQATWLLKLAGIDDRDAAELLRNQYIFVSMKDAIPLEEGEVYLFQIMGIRVVTTGGEELGKVVEFIETGANEVYVVQGTAYGEVLIPNIKPVVVSIDTEAGVMTVEPLPGLLPEK